MANLQHRAKGVVDICKELAAPVGGSSVSGVNGNSLSERHRCGRKVECNPQNSRKRCLGIGMDCSVLVFYHCDLDPTNILVVLANVPVGITDWDRGLGLSSEFLVE